MEEQSCANCKFSSTVTDRAYMYCKLKPPQLVPGEVFVDIDHAGRGGIPFCTNPAVGDDDWCGEWVAEEPTLLDPTAIQLAKEVLKGDLTAALALNDRLTEIRNERS